MITWMQKHNRYLVWTIWVATIAFIGAGFVGWGSYSYGSKASSVGEVGDIEISREKLNFTYRNLYDRYNEMYKGKFDEAKAKEMGLIKQAFGSLSSQAQILNLAKQYGVVVSDKELASHIATIKGFQDKGVFSKTIYRTYLKNRGLKSSTFESILSDELIVQKIMGLIESKASATENALVASSLNVADKIGYVVLSPNEAGVSLTEDAIKKAWEESKDNYMTPKTYRLAILWTPTNEINVTDAEMQEHYDKNSFNYVSGDGKQFAFEKVKMVVKQDLQVKKGKKQALLDYIALKKGKKSSQETQTVAVNDPLLSTALWEKIAQTDAGTLIKPQVVGSRYATVKLEQVNSPQTMPYAQAKTAVERQLKRARSADNLESEAKKTLETIEQASTTTSDYIRLSQKNILAPLNPQESLQFVQKLFTSSGKKGIIRLSKRVVVYKIIDQKMDQVDTNLTQSIQNETDQIKQRVFENALFEKLNTQFPVKAYAKGL